MRLLRGVLDGEGSREAIAKALSHGTRGLAAQMRAVTSAVFLGKSRDAFAAASRVALSWDGSGHEGLDVNVGLALDVGTFLGTYLRPKVRHD